jgi:hypothetical protein
MVSTAYIQQAEIVDIVFECVSTRRRGPGGILDLWQTVSRVLLGFKPINCDRLYYKSAELASRNAEFNIWTHTIHMACKKMITQEYDDENVAGPRITSISFNNSIS